MQLIEPGMLRDATIFLAAGVVFYSVFFALYLIVAWAKSPLRKIVDIRLAWAIFVLGLGINTLSFLISDVLILGESEYTLFIKMGYISMMFAVTGFFFALERILPYQTRYLFTIFGFIIACFTIFVPQNLMRIMAFGFGAMLFILLLMFFRYFKTYTTESTKLSYRLLFSGVLLGFVGFILRNEIILREIGAEYYLLGIFFLMIGIMMFGGSILQSPAYDELDWADQIHEIYVIADGGILMFHHRFQEWTKIDEDLAAAGISGFQDLLKEVTESEEGFRRVSIGPTEILFSHGNSIVTALVARAAYGILLEKIDDFTEKFELLFSERVHQKMRPLTGELAALLLVENVFLTQDIP
ncbi:MAG: hypothetical protein ACFFEF_12320 [Candidatus Thorarchaeota archaeon]